MGQDGGGGLKLPQLPSSAAGLEINAASKIKT